MANVCLCGRRRRQCFVCGDTGKDDVAGGVHKCQKGACGKFYHQHCATQMTHAVISKVQDEASLPSHLPPSLRSRLKTLAYRD